MQQCSIQGNSFQGVYKANNFNPTPHQKEMIKTIKDNFVNDTVIYRKGKNFHDFMDSKGYHFLLSNAEYPDEVNVDIVTPKKSSTTMIQQQNCGSFPESRLNDVVVQAKQKWKEHNNNIILFIFLGAFVVLFALSDVIFGKK